MAGKVITTVVGKGEEEEEEAKGKFEDDYTFHRHSTTRLTQSTDKSVTLCCKGPCDCVCGWVDVIIEETASEWSKS